VIFLNLLYEDIPVNPALSSMVLYLDGLSYFCAYIIGLSSDRL